MVYDLAVAPALDEAEAAQHTQVLRDRRLADSGDGGEITCAQLLLEEAVNYLCPAWVRERLECVSEQIILAVGEEGLASGTHTITARAYDNAGMDLVRQVPGTTFNRQYWGSGAMGHSDKTVTWTVTIP